MSDKINDTDFNQQLFCAVFVRQSFTMWLGLTLELLSPPASSSQVLCRPVPSHLADN